MRRLMTQVAILLKLGPSDNSSKKGPAKSLFAGELQIIMLRLRHSVIILNYSNPGNPTTQNRAKCFTCPNFDLSPTYSHNTLICAIQCIWSSRLERYWQRDLTFA